MGVDDDLSPDALVDVLGGRPVRSYPAVSSTAADALAWARSGAPEGAVVVAGYQAAPRGRGGLRWEVTYGGSLGFSVVLRPRLTPEREGWAYVAAVSGLADALGEGPTPWPGEVRVRWPDEVRAEGRLVGAVGVDTELGPAEVLWAVVNVVVPAAEAPRGPLLARAVEAIEHRARSAPGAVLDDYRPRCETLGRRVRARLAPLGPTEKRIEGTAVDVRDDGSLSIETLERTRVAVRPQHLGLLEELP